LGIQLLIKSTSGQQAVFDLAKGSLDGFLVQSDGAVTSQIGGLKIGDVSTAGK